MCNHKNMAVSVDVDFEIAEGRLYPTDTATRNGFEDRVVSVV